MNKELYLSFLRKQRELTHEYERLIEESSVGDIEEFIHFPILVNRRRIYVERSCPLSDSGSNRLDMLTKPGDRSHGLRELRDFTRESESLIIVDPYFFSGEKANAEKITEDLERCTRAKQTTLKRVHVIFDSESETKNVKKCITNMFKSNGVHLSTASTDQVHDRVWISDRERALVVGTSLNGIGNRAAFLLPLPDTDLHELLDFLDNKSLSRQES